MLSQWKIQSLCKSRTGDIVNINSIHVDISNQRKLISLGVVPGEEVIIISGEANSAYLIELSESQIILDWDTVKKIRVKANI